MQQLSAPRSSAAKAQATPLRGLNRVHQVIYNKRASSAVKVKEPVSAKPSAKPVAKPVNKRAAAIDAPVKPKELEDKLTSIRIWPTQLRVPRFLYSGVEYAVLLGTLAAVDAGWSGDWSRIGVITVEMEAQLRDFTLFVAVGHSVTAAITVWVAQNGGYNLGVAAAKGFFYGTLGILEVHDICENKGQDFNADGALN